MNIESDLDDEKFKTSSTKIEINFRANLLTYAGIIGGALTILSNSDGLVRLTHFAKVIASKWEEWTSNIWDYLFSFLKLPFYNDVFLDFTLAAMLLFAGVGGQLVWRHRNQVDSPWLDYSYIKGWHIPLGTVFLIAHSLASPILLDTYWWLYERLPDWNFLYYLALNWPFSIPALLCFAYKWPLRERLIGAFYVITIVSILDLGVFYSTERPESINVTPYSSIVVALTFTITAMIVMVIVNPAIFVKRLHHIVLIFLLLAVLNSFQEPLANLMITLFGK